MTGFFIQPRFANNRALMAAIACAVVCGIVFGLSMPLISLRLEYMTGSGLLVGLNGAATALSTLMMAPMVPRLMALAPSRTMLAVSLAMAGLLFLGFAHFANVTAWFVLRFTLGAFVTIVFVISESWINQIVTPQRRAFILGIYGTALSAGFGIGGLLFAAFNATGDLLFYIGSAIFVAGALPVLLLRGPQAVAPDQADATPSALAAAARTAPAAILAGVAFGAIETLLFSLMPVYAERIAFDTVAIGMMVFAIAMGALCFQIPLGWLADRTDRRATLTGIALVATIGPVLVWAAGPHLGWLLPVLFIQSGVASGLYTVGLSLLGERFTGGAIAGANAAFIFAYGLGSFLAPPIAGSAMDGFGPVGLLIVLGATAGAYLLVLLVRPAQTARSS